MKSLVKNIFAFLGSSIFAFIFNSVYNLFGHGVTSKSMGNMYLYLLICGTLFYTLILFVFPWIYKSKIYRLFTNFYNSGLTILIIGQLLKGIFDIAGTSSEFVKYYYYVGYASMFIGVLILLAIVIRGKNHNS